MIGNNVMKLNQATMIEAIQMWADKTFNTPPVVKSVLEVNNGEFTVCLEGEKVNADGDK